MTTTITSRISGTITAGNTKRVAHSGAVAGSSYDPWGGAWGDSWGTSWFVADVATPASPATDITPRIGSSVLGYQALNFAGGYVSFGDVLDLTGTFTVEALVRPSDVSSDALRIIAKDNAVAGWGLSIGDLGVSGRLRFFHRSLNTVSTDAPSGTMVANVFQHVAAVFDAEADTLTLYHNGVQVAQSTGQTNALATNSNDLRIGSAQAGGTVFAGIIDDVRIWNVARTQAQIDQNKYANLSGNESGLVALWELNATTGSTVLDSTSSANNGTIVGDVTRVHSTNITKRVTL